MRSFPFLWGSATSSHQVEGSNCHNDWWKAEQEGRVPNRSGVACDHHHLFAKDISLIKKLGHNTYRFSLEWSRLEPTQGNWDQSAFDYYHQLLEELRKVGVEPMVTLHHFTNPIWFSELGGWEKKDNLKYFYRYAQKAIQEFAPTVNYWITLNEPMVSVYFGYIEGTWPPFAQSFDSALGVLRHMIYAHGEVYQMIHDTYRKNSYKAPFVSLAKHMTHFEPCRKTNLWDGLARWLRSWFFNDLLTQALLSGKLYFPSIFSETLPYKKTLDFIAVNYYTREFVRYHNLRQINILGKLCDKSHHQKQLLDQNMLGWEIAPQGMLAVLKRLKKHCLPIVITENGICTLSDDQRKRFIQEHLRCVIQARQLDIPVQGYLYWSLLDNFEWAEGFGPRFGLIEVEYASQERKIRESAYVLSELCRSITK